LIESPFIACYKVPMSSLQIEVNDHTDVSLLEASAFSVKAEAGGLHGVGVHDHPGTGHDVFIRLAKMAEDTSHITLFPSVTNPITRHPTSIAASANSLGELFPGRIRIMMGSGDQATSYIGRRAATVAQMREAALAIRALTHGGSVTIDGRQVRAFQREVVEPPDLFINASSPRMLACAGETADGAYAMVGVHPWVVEHAREIVATGAKEAGRSPDSIPIAFGVPIYMGVTREEALESARAYAFSNASKPWRVFSTVMRERQIGFPVPEKPTDLRIRDLETIADALTLTGTPSECGERLATMISLTGVEHIVCRISYAGADQMFALESLLDHVVPHVRA
jgi:5,10-methylenetetrahydromethanopterin reductase